MSERSEILEQAAMAIESLFVEVQGHCPSNLYEDGYSDAIADAASAVRLQKLNVPAPWKPTERTIMRKTLRWRIYNLAFRILGRTPLWPRLGFAIWR